MLLQCSCGKVFRTKRESATPPGNCPSCGGVLQPVQERAPEGDPPARDPLTHLQSITESLSAFKTVLAERYAELSDVRKKLDESQQALLAEQSCSAQVLRDLRDELAASCQNSERRIQALNAQLAEARKDLDRGARLEAALTTRLKEAEESGKASLVRIDDLLAEHSRQARELNDVRAALATSCETSSRRIQELVSQLAETRKEAERGARLEVDLSSRLKAAQEAEARSVAGIEALQAEQSRSDRELSELRAALARDRETSERRIVELGSQLAESTQDADRRARLEAELTARLQEAEECGKASLHRIQTLEGKLQDQGRSLASVEGRATSAEQGRDAERKEKEGMQLRLSEALHRVEHLEQELHASALSASVPAKPDGVPKEEGARGKTAPGDTPSPGSLSAWHWYWTCGRCRRWNAPSSRECMRCSAPRLAHSG